jgi:hypothetical protein
VLTSRTLPEELGNYSILRRGVDRRLSGMGREWKSFVVYLRENIILKE